MVGVLSLKRKESLMGIFAATMRQFTGFEARYFNLFFSSKDASDCFAANVKNACDCGVGRRRSLSFTSQIFTRIDCDEEHHRRLSLRENRHRRRRKEKVALSDRERS